MQTFLCLDLALLSKHYSPLIYRKSMHLVPDESEWLYTRSSWHYLCRNNFSSHTEGGSCERKLFHNLVAMRKIPTPPPRIEHQSPSLQVCHFTYWVVVVHISKYREFWDGTHFHKPPAYWISFSLTNHVFYMSCFVNNNFNPLLEWNSICVLAYWSLVVNCYLLRSEYFIACFIIIIVIMAIMTPTTTTIIHIPYFTPV